MVNEGYQPIESKLDKSNPPKGGSGVSEDLTMKEIYERLRSPCDIDRIILKSGIIIIKC